MSTQHDTTCTNNGHTLLSQLYLFGLNTAISTFLRFGNPDPTLDIPFRHIPADSVHHSKEPDDFEVSKVELKITGTTPEDAFLYAELTVKSHELTPVELHMPLPSCKERYFINKNAISYVPDGLLSVLLYYFQRLADTLHFGEEIDL